MILLDTNVVSEAMKPDPHPSAGLAKASHISVDPESEVTSTIVDTLPNDSPL